MSSMQGTDTMLIKSSAEVDVSNPEIMNKEEEDDIVTPLSLNTLKAEDEVQCQNNTTNSAEKHSHRSNFI